MTKLEQTQVQAMIAKAREEGKKEGADEYAKQYLAQRAALDHPILRRFNDLTELLIKKGLRPEEAARHSVNLCSLVDHCERNVKAPGEASS